MSDRIDQIIEEEIAWWVDEESPQSVNAMREVKREIKRLRAAEAERDRLLALRDEIERFKIENALLLGELHAYRLLDAAGRIDRTSRGEE